jgi:NIPSNAP
LRHPTVVRSLALTFVLALLAPAPARPARPTVMAGSAEGASAGRSERSEGTRVVEIRSYNLKSGTRAEFHRLFERDALPLLRRYAVDVVAYGPSLHDSDSYFLIRSFASVGERQRSEDTFYGSAEWRQGPREAVLACIDTYTTVVIPVDDATLRSLRGVGGLPR